MMTCVVIIVKLKNQNQNKNTIRVMMIEGKMRRKKIVPVSAKQYMVTLALRVDNCNSARRCYCNRSSVAFRRRCRSCPARCGAVTLSSATYRFAPTGAKVSRPVVGKGTHLANTVKVRFPQVDPWRRKTLVPQIALSVPVAVDLSGYVYCPQRRASVYHWPSDSHL